MHPKLHGGRRAQNTWLYCAPGTYTSLCCCYCYCGLLNCRLNCGIKNAPCGQITCYDLARHSLVPRMARLVSQLPRPHPVRVHVHHPNGSTATGWTLTHPYKHHPGGTQGNRDRAPPIQISCERSRKTMGFSGDKLQSYQKIYISTSLLLVQGISFVCLFLFTRIKKMFTS